MLPGNYGYACTMECPVCYTKNCNCKLVCGHSFCKSCVKTWYLSTDSEPTCPMCRSTMCFKGMLKVTNEWEREFDDKKWDDIYIEAVNDGDDIEDAEEYFMFLKELEHVYKNIKKLYFKGYELSWDLIRNMLKNPFYFYIFQMYNNPITYEIWDDFEIIKKQTMFVSRYPKWKGLRI